VGYRRRRAHYVLPDVRAVLPAALDSRTFQHLSHRLAADYALGVDTKWQQQYRIWVTRTSDRLFVIYARCTHLGCTPDWKASENKFKCPCHGSGYDSEGVNFEGPAPRPMDRAKVTLDAEGQIVVDVGTLFEWPKGEKSEFDDPGAFISV
jgi:cytochrome b6-f complex iron-sulfur subunit